MSTRTTQKVSRNSLRFSILIPCILLLALSATLIILSLFSRQSNDMVIEAETEITFVAPQDSIIRLVGNSIVAVNSAGYTVYTLSGSTDGSVSYPLTDPTVCSSETALLVYGTGTNKAYYLKPGNRPVSITAPGNIIHGCICNKKGFALVTDSEYFKGELTLYDLKGNILFSYKCSEGFPYLCSLSPDFTLIACAILGENENGLPATSLYTFSPDRDVILGKLDIETEVINNLSCNSNDRITIISETGIYTTDENAELVNHYELVNESLLFYSVASDYTFLLTKRQDTSSRYGLVSIDENGAESARISSSVLFHSIAFNGQHIALLSDRLIQVYDKSLSSSFTVSHKYSVSDISLSGDNKLICRTDSGVSIYKY